MPPPPADALAPPSLYAHLLGADWDRLPPQLLDAYFQLVLYPVRSSASLNQRILKLDLAAEYARQQRPSSNLYVRQARQAHAAIAADAAAYNALANGKWAHFMDVAPRRLPVFAEPVYSPLGRAKL